MGYEPSWLDVTFNFQKDFTMSIEKNTKNTLLHEEGGFTTLINETISSIRNDSALGIYCYLASKPSNWEICKKHLQNHFNCGRDKINKSFNYLKQIGLIEINPIRNELGHIEEWETKLKRKISEQSACDVQNTENPYSSDSSRILKTHNVDKPHSGKSALSNKGTIKKEVRKKTNKEANPISVFSDALSIKERIDMIIAIRGVFIEEDTVNQIVFYVGRERDYELVSKKINVALKKIREGKWNIPNGYKNITYASIKEKESAYEMDKKRQIQQDIIAMNYVKEKIIDNAREKAFQKMRMSLQ